jgi:hypothetical protein
MERDDLIEKIASGLEEDIRLRLKQMRIDRQVLKRGLQDYLPSARPAEGNGAVSGELMQSLAVIEAGRSQCEVLGTMLREIAHYAGGGAIIILAGAERALWPGPGMGRSAGTVFGSKKIPFELPENSLASRAAREGRMLIAPFPGAPGDLAIYAALGFEPPLEVAYVPLIVRCRAQAVVVIEGKDRSAITDPEAISVIVRFTGFVIDLLSLKEKIGGMAMPLPVSLPRFIEPVPEPEISPAPVEEVVEEAAATEVEVELEGELEIEYPREIGGEEEAKGEVEEVERVAEVTAVEGGEKGAEMEFELLEIAPPTESEEPVPDMVPEARPKAKEEPEIPPIAREPEVEFELAGEGAGGESLEIGEPPEIAQKEEVVAPGAEELTAGPETGEKLVPESRGLSVDHYDLSELTPEERERHEKAIRFARLLVSEIKLYNEEAVQLGRENADIISRLREDIERSRQLYNERIGNAVRDKSDYFEAEILRQLAGGDESLLGE